MLKKLPWSIVIVIIAMCFSLFACSTYSSFLAPITKSQSKYHFTISVYLKTPPQPTDLLLDLGGTISWIDCTTNYTSSTLHPIPCTSSLCHALGSQPPGSFCNKDHSCWLYSRNSLTGKPFLAQAPVDSLNLPITDGRNPGQLGTVPEFLFSCSKRGSVKGIDKKLAGLAGLGRSNFSLPEQVSNVFSLPHVFALCLSDSPSAPGVGFFGTRGPYYFLPEIDLSKYLIYTPLLSISNKSYSKPSSSSDYYIALTSIKINGKDVPFDQKSLITKLSTVKPYTKLQTSIYKTFVELFEIESAALNLTARPPVKPFGLCYNVDDVALTRVGPAVPTVDLVMGSDNVFWRIFGVNSMVRIYREDVDAWCLGFVDGGPSHRTSVVIGGHQIVDNLLQFDLDNKRLGFTSSVLAHNTMCANFNFTNNSNLG